MKKSENVLSRMFWLKSVVKGAEDNHEFDYEKVRNAKVFCEMELTGSFEKIAYNTLKDCLLRTTPAEFGVHAYGNNFDYFLQLRKGAYEYLLKKKAGPAVRPPGEVSNWKSMYRNALWQSNLSSVAYLSLRRDILALLDEGKDESKLSYRKLEKIMNRSTTTYYKIVSRNPEASVPDLVIVRS